jgi:3-oxoadipate enol-lactonase
MEHLKIDDAMIEYQVQGHGEPVLLIPPSLTADGLGLPLLGQPELASRYQLIHYHRRGYMGSTLGAGPLTTTRQAADAAALLRHLGVSTAHVAGHSYGGQIALQLALDAPELVHSLALLEPPLRMVPSGQADLGRVFGPMLDAYRTGNKRAAVVFFSEAVFGPNWQAIVERAIPGGAEQAVKNVDTFIQELPAIRDWQFGPEQAAVIHQPVLSVLGVNSRQFMKEGRQLIHAWFPQAEDYDVPTTHLLQMQEPEAVAHGLAEFFARHPIMSNPIKVRLLANHEPDVSIP